MFSEVSPDSGEPTGSQLLYCMPETRSPADSIERREGQKESNIQW